MTATASGMSNDCSAAPRAGVTTTSVSSPATWRTSRTDVALSRVRSTCAVAGVNKSRSASTRQAAGGSPSTEKAPRSSAFTVTVRSLHATVTTAAGIAPPSESSTVPESVRSGDWDTSPRAMAATHSATIGARDIPRIVRAGVLHCQTTGTHDLMPSASCRGSLGSGLSALARSGTREPRAESRKPKAEEAGARTVDSAGARFL